MDHDEAEPPAIEGAALEATVIFGGRLRPRTATGLLKSYIARQPLSIWRNSPKELLRTVVNDLPKINWDLVYVDHWLMIEASEYVQAQRRVLHLHNAEPEIFFRAAQQLKGAKKLASLLEGSRSAHYLRSKITNFDELHLLSQSDNEELNKHGAHHLRTEIFPPSVQTSPLQSHGGLKRSGALFVGSLSWHPNAEGMLWFGREVLPELDKSIRIEVIGGGADTRFIEAFQSEQRVSLHGYVEALDVYYQKAKFLIAPLLSGSGIKIKIVNALSHGVPVVTTPIGLEGFPRDWGSSIRVAETARDFAAYMFELNNLTPAEWAKAHGDATRYARRHFDGKKWNQWCEHASR